MAILLAIKEYPKTKIHFMLHDLKNLLLYTINGTVCIIHHSLFCTPMKILIKIYACIDVVFLTIIKNSNDKKLEQKQKIELEI